LTNIEGAVATDAVVGLPDVLTALGKEFSASHSTGEETILFGSGDAELDVSVEVREAWDQVCSSTAKQAPLTPRTARVKVNLYPGDQEYGVDK
jgi:hypothetical protein